MDNRAARFSYQWPPAGRGMWRVAKYKADTRQSPVVYHAYSVSDRRTLKAAIREIAHLIARQARRGYRGERFDCLYIITPEGARLPLTAARKMAEESGR